MQARRARVKASAPYKMHGALVAEQASVRRASSAWQHSCCGAGSVMQALYVRKDASARRGLPAYCTGNASRNRHSPA